MQKLIDLTAPFAEVSSDMLSPKIKYVSHRKAGTWQGLGAIWSASKPKLVRNAIGYLTGRNRITSKDFPDGIGLASEVIKAHTHSGTHMDAPWHFGQTVSGTDSKTIDKVPLEWCFGDGVLLDVRPLSSGDMVSLERVQNALDTAGYKIKPLDIVLILTGADEYWGTPKYMEFQPGMAREAVIWLLEQGVKIIGIDAWGFDKPFSTMMRNYKNTANKNELWPAHLVGRDMEYCHIEKLANLHQIPQPTGFKVACFPINVKKASAGWVRVVALLDEEMPNG